jgi:hypothetical protein
MHPIKSDRNYESLLNYAQLGLRYVVACIDPKCEPNYQGYATMSAATAAAEELEANSEYLYSVMELVQDERGDWYTDYEDKRFS